LIDPSLTFFEVLLNPFVITSTIDFFLELCGLYLVVPTP
jgi:hypothetical protein